MSAKNCSAREGKRINGGVCLSESQRGSSFNAQTKCGFGAFLMKVLGTSQSIVTDTANIKKNWDEGLRITACAARVSTFYIVMTKDTKEYKGKSQTWFTGNTWNEVNCEIQKGWRTKTEKLSQEYATQLA